MALGKCLVTPTWNRYHGPMRPKKTKFPTPENPVIAFRIVRDPGASLGLDQVAALLSGLVLQPRFSVQAFLPRSGHTDVGRCGADLLVRHILGRAGAA